MFLTTFNIFSYYCTSNIYNFLQTDIYNKWLTVTFWLNLRKEMDFIFHNIYQSTISDKYNFYSELSHLVNFVQVSKLIILLQLVFFLNSWYMWNFYLSLSQLNMC